jgi:gamma-glutamyltranspeptidase/glutathione hydrolase
MAMMLYRAREDRYEVIDYDMRAPGSLRPEDYPLTRDGAAFDIFPWPRVIDDRNLHGPGTIAVPGVVAGMEEAHRRHAKLPWKELLGPSVDLRNAGAHDQANPRKGDHALRVGASGRRPVKAWAFGDGIGKMGGR